MLYVPKSGIAAAKQFFQYKLYRQAGESRQEWAERVCETLSDCYSDMRGLAMDNPLSYREFGLYTWTCLVDLAEAENAVTRTIEYRSAKEVLNNACINNALLKPVAFGATVVRFLTDRSDQTKIENDRDNLGYAYEKLWGGGVTILQTYLTENRLMPLSEVFDKYEKNPLIVDLLNKWYDSIWVRNGYKMGINVVLCYKSEDSWHTTLWSPVSVGEKSFIVRSPLSNVYIYLHGTSSDGATWGKGDLDLVIDGRTRYFTKYNTGKTRGDFVITLNG